MIDDGSKRGRTGFVWEGRDLSRDWKSPALDLSVGSGSARTVLGYRATEVDNFL